MSAESCKKSRRAEIDMADMMGAIVKFRLYYALSKLNKKDDSKADAIAAELDCLDRLRMTLHNQNAFVFFAKGHLNVRFRNGMHAQIDRFCGEVWDEIAVEYGDIIAPAIGDIRLLASLGSTPVPPPDTGEDLF
jgi:hypothetical protein